MAQAHELTAGSILGKQARARSASWLFSWPLLMGMCTYLFFIWRGETLLRDGDTFWHIAAGQWIIKHGAVPSQDPFSHSMPAAAWTAHEWVSEILLATAHAAGGWTLVVAMSALAIAVTIALLTRALLTRLEPIYALMFAALAVCMAAGHVLARPHVLAMPILMIWTIELVRASEAGRAPRLWMVPLMSVWANMHGGFTFGIVLALAFALESLLTAWREQRVAAVAKSWGIFIVLAAAAALVTPHGVQGIAFTWQVLVQDSYALQRIGEWQSPNFHMLQPLELWLLAGLALVLHQGLRLPAVRLILLLGLLHLSLKHMRSIELLGLLAPLFVAAPFAQQWQQRKQHTRQLESADRFFLKLARPAGPGALLVAAAFLVALPPLLSQARPLQLPEIVAPAQAVQAVQKAKLQGPVLNSYGFGGYLIFNGIPAFIDGRSDMYREAFLKQYAEAMELRTSDALDKVLDKYAIGWTLLEADVPAVALLDRMPEWRRVHTDKTAVVHARIPK
jgi:hypothetical protein